jgi:putative flippase GtrA
MPQQFSRFIVVGAIGFIIDACVLSTLVHLFYCDPYWSRLPSFILAATCTWHLNYHWAFAQNKNNQAKLLNFLRYFAVQSAGITVNLVIYTSLLFLFPYFYIHPEFSLTIASIFTLAFNYLGLNDWVFKTKKPE